MSLLFGLFGALAVIFNTVTVGKDVNNEMIDNIEKMPINIK